MGAEPSEWVLAMGEETQGVLRRKEIREFCQDMLSSLEMGPESEERPEQVVFDRADDETGGLDLEKWRKR